MNLELPRTTLLGHLKSALSWQHSTTQLRSHYTKFARSLWSSSSCFRHCCFGNGCGPARSEYNHPCGAPCCIEDYFQESGRGGRSGGAAKSIVYWKPTDCPRVKDALTLHQREVNDIRAYLQNSTVYRRKWLLKYFSPECAKSGSDPSLCCDVCAAEQ